MRELLGLELKVCPPDDGSQPVRLGRCQWSSFGDQRILFGQLVCSWTLQLVLRAVTQWHTTIMQEEPVPAIARKVDYNHSWVELHISDFSTF